MGGPSTTISLQQSNVKSFLVNDDDDDDDDDDFDDDEDDEEKGGLLPTDIEKRKPMYPARHSEITNTQRKQAAALHEDPRLLTHDRLNEIFRPMVDYNDFVIR